MIDAEARIARPGIHLVIPERPHRRGRVPRLERVGPPLCPKPAERRAGFRLHQRVRRHRCRPPHIGIGRDDIIVARQYHGLFRSQQRRGARIQSFKPTEFVIELRPRVRVAVRKVNRRNHNALYLCLKIAAVRIVGVVRKPAQTFYRIIAAHEDGDTIEPFLAVPNNAVARVTHVGFGKSFVARLQFLQTGDIGLGLVQPFEQPRQPRLDPVDVVSRDFQFGRTRPKNSIHNHSPRPHWDWSL